MRKIIIVTASLFTLTASHAQDAAKAPKWWPRGAPWVEVTAGFEAWRACVIAKAERFSKGPDAAELIVEAALSACEEERNRVLQQVDEKEPEKKDSPKVVGPYADVGLTPSANERFVGRLEARIHGEALLRIIEVRAAK